MSAWTKAGLGLFLGVVSFVLAVNVLYWFPALETECLITAGVLSAIGTFLQFSAVRDLRGWEKFVCCLPAIAAVFWSVLLAITAGESLFGRVNPHPWIWY